MSNNEKKEVISEEDLFRAKNKMSTCRAKLLLRQPFYGVLLSMTDIIPELSIPTMATDGIKIFYSPEFVLRLSEEEVFGTLLHEIGHCIYLHCTTKRRLNRESKKWNVASDFAINYELKSIGYNLPGDILYDRNYAEMNAEQIYDALPQDVDNMETFDTHIENDDEADWDDMEEKIIASYEMTKNSDNFGHVPAGLRRWIDKLRKSKVKWERIFHKYVGQALAKDDYSFTRINKRFVGQDMYLPDHRSFIIGNVVIVIDTSGSIDKILLEQFAAEIQKVSHLVSEITAMTCDAVVHEVVKIRKFDNWLKKLQMKGGGGTAFEPAFDEVKKLKLQPELLIYLTDAWGSFPAKAPNYPVLWVVTEESGMGHIPWGQKVLMPQDHKNRY